MIEPRRARGKTLTMSDLDDLARAAHDPTSSGTPPYRPDQQFVPADEGVVFDKPDTSRLATWVWLGAGVTIVLVLAVSFEIIRYNTAPADSVTAPPSPPQSKMPLPPQPASANTERAPVRTKSYAIPGRELLEDISDPTKALQIYHCQRGAGDTLEIKARNRSKRGLFVKSVQFFAESDQNNPLADIGFWLPVGGGVQTAYPVQELSRHLKPDEKVIAVIVEADFRDEPPPQPADSGAAPSTSP
jgi:hypothetical protein